MKNKLTKRTEDYSKWYNEIVVKADLAENSGVKGCMVIKPYGYAIWENIQQQLDKMFKETGHQNAYFPLMIPKSHLSREANHVEGFAKECAVITHYRLKVDNKKNIVVDPKAKLEEELIIRPTSETIIWDTFKRWINSYRDLPLKINQWANVVRWEMRTRLFLRTSEFLWQEGHTAHESKQEAIQEAELINNLYADFAENFMAMPVIKGLKSESERFAGAEKTYCIEALMQDGKALQAGTSHFLGQNFAKAFDVKYTNKMGKIDYVWATSWGVSTRLIGGLIMTHSDDNGLVLPPKLAPIQLVIIPIYKGIEQLNTISNYLNPLLSELKKLGISVHYDDNDKQSPGWKFNQYELKGIPIRIAIGERDIAKKQYEVVRRDTHAKELVPNETITEYITNLLDEIQKNLFKKAQTFVNIHITQVDNFEDFKAVLKNKTGFVAAHWDGNAETEAKIKNKTKATIRCIPLKNEQSEGLCVFTGKPSKQRVLFAKAY